MPALRLLLVEDNPGDARLIEEALADAGDAAFELRNVQDLASGFEQLEQLDFSLVLADLNLPDSVGLDTFQRIKAQAPQLPVIVLTGLKDENLGVKAVQLGAQDYLIKGEVDGQLLVRAIRYAIEREQTKQKIKALNADLERRVEERTRELAKTAEALSRANRELRELDRMKTSFIRVTSHELSTPVQVILGMISILEQYESQGAGGWENALAVASRRATGLQRLVSRILEIAQVGEYRTRLERKPAEVEELVRQVVTEVTPFSSLRQQQLEVVLPRDLPPALMDQTKIRDVLLNLMMNAVKFTPDGGKITVTVQPSDKRLRFAVRDTGVGVQEADVPHIFDEFFSSFDTEHHSSGEYEFGKRGIGLGLSIAKEFVKLHDGKLWLEPREDGTTFVFEIPV